MAKKFSDTKEGKVSNLRWQYVTAVKLGHKVEKSDYLEKILRTITKGTRFQEHIDAMDQAKQVKRKAKKGRKDFIAPPMNGRIYPQCIMSGKCDRVCPMCY